VNSTLALEVPFLDLKAQYRQLAPEINRAVASVLESAQFVGGQFVENFEQEFASYIGARYAVGVSSGTSALELALKVAGIGPGDEVLVPANTFFATAEAVNNVGASPVFTDVDSVSFHLNVNSAERMITSRTRAIIPVHLYGRAVDLGQVIEFADAHCLRIIEDAAQAHGSTHNGINVGAAGRLTCFSFYPGKNLGAYGDAGAVTTNDYGEALRLRLLRDHGSPAKYQHSVIGTNSRLDSIQAAILSIKLGQLDQWNQLRRKHAARMSSALADSPVVPPEIPIDGEHVFHLFVVRTPQRNALRRYLRASGIGSGIHYPVPLHLTEAYQQLGYPGKNSLPVAEQVAEEILSLPMYPELSDEQIEYTIDAILNFAG
jgi:dTDP-3-amino-3,4,6-trideoxy-alpha-D-glucose transaminase